jgi:hypothetical protein
MFIKLHKIGNTVTVLDAWESVNALSVNLSIITPALKGV